jgi:LytS/YehU family sensor histidine kinase
VALKDELNIVKDYLALESVRFEDRLNVQYDIQENTLDQFVPSMMLQLMAENAIKHGISREINGGVIKISSRIENDILELCVENTGQLTECENSTGFGIKSTEERLRLLYGEKGNFEIKQTAPFTVKAKITIPVFS